MGDCGVGAMRGYGYIRVSGDEQAKRGTPVEGQREAIETYAQEHGIDLVRVFKDEARSGGSDDREEFQRIYHLCRSKPRPADVILIWSWSRFARNQDDAHFYKADLRRMGVQIIDVSGEVPASSDHSLQYVFESFIHWKDEIRRKEISADATRGQQTIARKGYIPSGCSPPRGLRAEIHTLILDGREHKARRWVIDPEVWPRVIRAWRMRLEGRSLKAIWAETQLYRSASCYSTFFGNTAYKGEVNFGGTIVPVPAAVSVEEWARVNEGRPKWRGGAAPRLKSSRFLLSGLLRCARCGSALVGWSSSTGKRNDGYERRRWDGYVCLKRRRGECDLPWVDARDFERMVIDALMREILTEDNLRSQLATIEAERSTRKPELEASLQGKERALSEARRGLERLLDAIERTPDSAALADRLRGREAAIGRLEREIGELRVELAGPSWDPIQVEELRGALGAALEAGTEEAREIVQRVIVKIEVDAGRAAVRYGPPFAVAT